MLRVKVKPEPFKDAPLFNGRKIFTEPEELFACSTTAGFSVQG
jgi:hypothetical protein